MTITISADDPRSIKAIAIAATAKSWIPCTGRDGRPRVGIPSQCRADTYYVIDPEALTCDCPDFKRNGLSLQRVGYAGEHGACKHLRAWLLNQELVKAQELPKRRRGRLSVVPADVFDRFVGD